MIEVLSMFQPSSTTSCVKQLRLLRLSQTAVAQRQGPVQAYREAVGAPGHGPWAKNLRSPWDVKWVHWKTSILEGKYEDDEDDEDGDEG